ncbi:GNAT family N-acetyltransferase, partial [Turicibacter sanguinis]|nr:GNAT family N-acetyltransferase [Turicibacter sanguinis]
MKVRLGTVEDIDLIVRLNNELNQMMSKLQPDDFKKISEDIDWVQQYLLNEKADYLLLEDEGEIRGLALVEQLESIDLPSLLKRHYVY